MPVTRADATPPLLYSLFYLPSIMLLSPSRSTSYGTYVFTRTGGDERRGTRSCEEVARRLVCWNRARREAQGGVKRRGAREREASECRARVDGGVVSIFFSPLFFLVSTAPPCSATGVPVSRLAAPRLALFFPRIMYVLGARVAFRGGVVRVRPVVPPVINNLET